VVAVANEKLFTVLAKVIGRPDMIGDPRFASDARRTENRDEVSKILNSWASDKSAAQAVRVLSDAGVPASSVWNVQEAAQSAHVLNRELLHRAEHPSLGHILIPEQPIHFSGVPREEPSPAPCLGA